MKALLAAGWVIVLGTLVRKSVQRQLQSPAIWNTGLLLSPLPDNEEPKDGHAWCLVGYDHVDGSLHWKYQGRFIALNSWGPDFGRSSSYRGGMLTIPFAFVVTEAVEAVAVRL